MTQEERDRLLQSLSDKVDGIKLALDQHASQQFSWSSINTPITAYCICNPDQVVTPYLYPKDGMFVLMCGQCNKPKHIFQPTTTTGT